MPHAEHRSPEMDECIQACLDCYRSCQQTALTHCLELGGRHTEPDHFRLMLDCAEACRATAALMLGDSPYHAASCALCAEICRACAESCRALGDMDACVDACERCAESCEGMAASAGKTRQGKPARPAASRAQ